jgi:signal transduction histidine kinase
VAQAAERKQQARSRFLPDSMGARLVLTGMLLAFVTAAVTVGIDAWLVSAQVDAWTRNDLAAGLDSFHSLLSLEAQDVRASVDRVASDQDFRTLVTSSDRAGLASRFSHIFRAGTIGYATIALDSSGTVLISSGEAVDVAALRTLVMARPSQETSGLVAMAGTTAVVYGVPVPSSSGGSSAGYIVAARLFGESQAARFAAVTSAVSIALRPAGWRPVDTSLTPQQAGGESFSMGSTSGAVVAVQDLPALGGGSAGVVELRDNDPQGVRTTSIALTSALLSGLIAIAIGAGLGVLLTGVMRRPVLQMIEHLKTQGFLAAEGVPYSAQELARDATLPVEFRELGSVMEDLLRHLNARQAELQGAIREAEYAEDSLGVVVSESPEVKIVLQNGRIIIANPAAGAAFGLPASQLTDLTASEAMRGVEIRDEEGVRYDAETLIERALAEPVTVSITEPGRLEHWYVVQAVVHAGDRHERTLFTARDVTEERRLALIRAEIVSIVGHDLRSPLTVVIGYLDLMKRPMTDEQRAMAIDTARRNAGRMADLLEDLLTATRAEELLAPSELAPTRLADVAQEVVNSLGPTHAERKLLLETGCDPVVLGEEKRLRQLLVNLVTNAYKYTPETDPVLVRVRCDETDAFLEVVDHGPGIPEDDRAHVFERFARLANTAGRPGIGLGLYIVSIIAHNHGGEAYVEETPGGGATFAVRLPLAGHVIDGEPVLDVRPLPEG